MVEEAKMPDRCPDEVLEHCFSHLDDFNGKTSLSAMFESLQNKFKISHEESVEIMRSLMAHGEVKVEYEGNVAYVSRGYMTSEDLEKLLEDMKTYGNAFQ